MATNRPLPSDVTVTGVDQASLVKWMQNVTDGLNELIDDHATLRLLSTSLKTKVNGLIAAAGTTSASFAGLAAVGAVTAAAVATLSDSTDITLLRS